MQRGSRALGMARACLVIAPCVACGTPAFSARSATGIRVESVTVEGLGNPTVIRGQDPLRKMVALLDRDRLTELAEELPSTSCLSGVKITLETTSYVRRRTRVVCIIVSEAWSKFGDVFAWRSGRCAFFWDAHHEGLVSEVPIICANFKPAPVDPCAIR